MEQTGKMFYLIQFVLFFPDMFSKWEELEALYLHGREETLRKIILTLIRNKFLFALWKFNKLFNLQA